MHKQNPVLQSSHIDEADNSDEDFQSLSWSLEPGPVVIKKTDRPFFLYRETVIPEKVQTFFSSGDLQPGHKQSIVFYLGEDRFDAFIEKTSHLTPITRIIWKADFATVLGTTYPKWLEYFKKSRGVLKDTPTLSFRQRDIPHQYDVAFDDAPAPGASPIAFTLPLRPGDTIDNETLQAIFSCSANGTMRRSSKTGSLVVISDRTRSPYRDTWMNNFFHYTGHGLCGKNGFFLPENQSLLDAKTNGTRLYLFEVSEAGHYVFMGEVELADRPFLSRQADSERNFRDICIFPLRLIGRKRPPLHFRGLEETRDELLKRNTWVSCIGTAGSTGTHSLKCRSVHKTAFPAINQEQLTAEQTRHQGICQLCERPAPFCIRNGEPYLETHHIHWLSKGGEDVRENTVLLCPNCHRKMHVLDLPEDVARLKRRSTRS